MRIIFAALFSLLFVQNINSQVRVNGYYRKNGTYVEPHYRSSPNSSPFDNYSFPGNTNPYTGKLATGNSETYLNNYYKNSNQAGVTPTSSLSSQLSNINIVPTIGNSDKTNDFKKREMEKVDQLLKDLKSVQRKNL
jgi:hypothetical protein